MRMMAPTAGLTGMTLEQLRPARRARVVALRLPEKDAAWLSAVGLASGDNVLVLRRAPFGGPLHVRTLDGGELALDRSLARRIDVEPGLDADP